MLSAKQKNNHKYSFFTKRIKYIALVLLISVFASTCLLPISEAKAQVKAKIIKGVGGKVTTSAGKGTAGGAARSLPGWLVTTITVVVIFAFVDILFIIAKSFVDYMLSPDPALYNLNSAFVQRGWKVIRDICNLFFLLVLLFIAFCTILQIEKSNAKKNLLTLILMALLINFSTPIAIFIFDGSQLAMDC